VLPAHGIDLQQKITLTKKQCVNYKEKTCSVVQKENMIESMEKEPTL
jgi:4-hydroxy-3-methylbut-2-enyl diphosphate reductase IspH